ncbi:MAG: LacI family DNA-binding transcriptional regulator [bacterium]
MATLQDVAREANVSVATVSRVMNNAKNVRDETRARVQAAIRSLGFQPSRVARRLRSRTGNNQLIGLVVPDIQNPFFVEVVRGVEEAAYSNGHAVLLSNYRYDEEKERLYLNLMKSESVDGLIIIPNDRNDRAVQNLIRSGLPIVCVDREVDNVDADAVIVDNRRGAFEATKHLIRLKNKRIGYISGPVRMITSVERLEGFKDAMVSNGLEIDENLIRVGDYKYESGSLLAGELLDLDQRPTALFVANSLMTLGALEAIHRRGLKIPEDVALIGFDDMAWAISLNPPLTAVSQPGFEIGRRAAELLFQRIADPKRQTARVVLETRLVIRKSCGAEMNQGGRG